MLIKTVVRGRACLLAVLLTILLYRRPISQPLPLRDAQQTSGAIMRTQPRAIQFQPAALARCQLPR
jgi:hypothetical protein